MAEVTVWTPAVIEDTRAKVALLQLSGMQAFHSPVGGWHVGRTRLSPRHLYKHSDREWEPVTWPFGGFGTPVEWADVRMELFRTLSWGMIHAFLQT